jgi:Ca2+-binding RTX toxin-like protein
MAKKSIIELTPEFFEFDIDDIDPIIVSATKTELSFFDFGTEMEYTISGSGLKVVNGLVVGGTIETFEIQNLQGENVMSASRLGINAGVLTGGSLQEQGASLTTVILLNDNDIRGTDEGEAINGSRGNDIIRGNGGDDTLYGSFGKDALIGGEGSDNFVFTFGMGKDTIKDFDFDDSDGFADKVDIGGANFRESGKDTIIDYGEDDIFVLKNVKLSDFEDSLV